MLKNYLFLSKIFIINFLRDRQTLFFTIVFPLIFLIIFGFMYADTGGELRGVNLAFYSNNETGRSYLLDILGEREGLHYNELLTEDEVISLVRAEDADMGLIHEENNLYFYFNPAQFQQNSYLEQIARGIRADMDIQQAGLIQLFSAKQEDIGGRTGASQLEFLFPGIIALGMASSGLFMMTASFTDLREKGVLKRLIATPMKKMIFLAGLITSRLLASVLSAVIVLLTGLLVFNVSFNIYWPTFIPYIFIGTLIMMGFGALIILFTKTAESAAQASGLFLTIMIFFSGIYLPVEFLPSYFQTMSLFLPLSYIARGLRYTMGIEAISFMQLGLESVLLLAVSLLLIWVVSVKSGWTRT